MVAYISVKDPDSGLAGQFLCQLNEPHFSLEQTQPTKFKVVTAAQLDRERQEEYALVIECQDQGNPSLVTSKTIVVKILDENDNVPIFSQDAYYEKLSENNHVKAWILQVNATDKDSGENGEVRFSLVRMPMTNLPLNQFLESSGPMLFLIMKKQIRSYSRL